LPDCGVPWYFPGGGSDNKRAHCARVMGLAAECSLPAKTRFSGSINLMLERWRRFWFAYLLYWLTLAVSSALILLVFLSPLLDNKEARPQGWSLWLAVFARDLVLRRTAVASALCLTVTGCVFFRPPRRRRLQKGKPPKPPPPVNMAGA
jgi:hypothetical protein